MIHYAVYYSTKDSGRVKNYAGEEKVDYICQVLNDLGEDVVIISNAKTIKHKFAKRNNLHLYGKTSLLYFSSLPKGNIVLHAIDVLWGYLQLIVYVFTHVKKKDTVLVYHSMGYRGVWGLLRRIKRFNYILEVEELFQTFEANTSGYKQHERKVFKYPDAYLFSNSILADEVNTNHKPAAVINGIYKSNKRGQDSQTNRKKKKIRVVYAGSLEKQKGVDYVIQAASHLPAEYEIRIVGFGTNKDVERINKLIESSCGNVKYDGVFKGEEYIDYIQSCNIGVCVQDENDEFNKYEYPSKIFSYLSNGLQVVANDLIQLRRSEVFPYLHIANSKESQDIAEAIVSCGVKRNKPEDILDELNDSFRRNINELIRR